MPLAAPPPTFGMAFGASAGAAGAAIGALIGADAGTPIVPQPPPQLEPQPLLQPVLQPLLQLLRDQRPRMLPSQLLRPQPSSQLLQLLQELQLWVTGRQRLWHES